MSQTVTAPPPPLIPQRLANNGDVWNDDRSQRKRPSFASELEQYQSMIDLYTLTLKKLRESNTPTARQEVRRQEGNLMALFCDQLTRLAEYEASASDVDPNLLKKYPNVRQWLDVVGLRSSTIDALMARRLRLLDMTLLSGADLVALLNDVGADDEDRRCLRSALSSLKRRMEFGTAIGSADLAWGSLRNQDSERVPSPPSSYQKPLTLRPPISPNQSPVLTSRAGSPSHQHSSTIVGSKFARSPTPVSLSSTTPLSSTPPSTPGSTKTFLIATASGSLRRTNSNDDRFMHGTKAGSMSNLSLRLTTERMATPSRRRNISCETLLEPRKVGSLPLVNTRTDSLDSVSGTNSMSRIRSWVAKRSSKRKKDSQEEDFAVIPLSPGPVTLRLGHSIEHKFHNKVFLPSQECDYCHKHMLRGKKCSECKFRSHSKCLPFVPSSCGLPHGYEKFFRMQLLKEEPAPGTRYSFVSSSSSSPPSQHRYDHYSTSATPPSAAKIRSISSISSPLTLNEGNGGGGVGDTRRLAGTYSHGDLLSGLLPGRRSPPTPLSMASSASNSPTLHTPPPNGAPLTAHPVVSERRSFQFPSVDDGNATDLFLQAIDYRLSGRHSTLSVHQPEASSSSLTKLEALQVEMNDDPFELDSCDSEVSLETDYSLRHFRARHRGSLLTEWEIPFSDLKMMRKIGEGKMGDVYQAKWHGYVCVKMLQLAEPTEKQLAEFRHEVSILKKTRHENVVLFMGACLLPPKLAIITSYLPGEPLYRLIHEKDEHFTTNRTLLIAIQIVHGMGYLHARSIVHKDLRSKNVFLEKGAKVVITDFGLSTVSDEERKKNRPGYLRIPPGHLCYLPPEIISKLRPSALGLGMVKRTKASDVYAFGILWYELLTGKWPYARLNVERTIFNIGSSMKPSLGSLRVTQSTRNELGKCLSRDSLKRPSFSTLYTLLDRLPKKSLERSPSYPTKLTTTKPNLAAFF